MTAKACLRSMRLRTLPLSLAGIALGVLLVAQEYGLDALTVLLLALTTVFLQILSNLSNEFCPGRTAPTGRVSTIPSRTAR